MTRPEHYRSYSAVFPILLREGANGREVLLHRVWGFEYCGGTRTVDVHIRTLRQKLGDGGALIETVRGVGYRMGGNA